MVALPLVSPGGAPVGTVLVVDDDADYRRVLAGYLDGWATRVIEAANGAQALALMTEEPEVILVDLRMPEVDGYQLLELLEADERLRDIPVIVITSADVRSDERVRHAREVLDKSRLTAPRLAYALDRTRRRPE